MNIKILKTKNLNQVGAFIERYERQMNVKTMFCTFWELVSFHLRQCVIWTLFQCSLNVMDVRWTLKQRYDVTRYSICPFMIFTIVLLTQDVILTTI